MVYEWDKILNYEWDIFGVREILKNFVIHFFYDVSDVVKDNNLLKLAKPYSNAGTSRTQATLKFDIEFSEYESKFGRIL